MAITYAETAELMNNADFQGRTKIACMKFATYIDGEPSSTPAYNTRQRWVQAVYQDAGAEVAKIMPKLVMDDRVQDAGASITDDDLQIAVETTVNQLF
jgi:hypothetical protein